MAEELTTGLWISMLIVLTICILGIMGNSLCIWVLLQKEMKGCYNYLLLGLGFSDLFLLILSTLRSLSNLKVFTFDQNIQWVGLVIFFWDWICTGGTKYFTVAISLERYFVICFPLKAHRYVTETRAKIFAICVFLFTLGLAGFSYLYNFHIDQKSFNIYAAVVLHFFPFLAVLVLNLFIYLGLRRFQRERKSLTDSESSEVSVTRMLLVIVLVFGICYSFEFIRRIMTYAGKLEITDDVKYYDYLINHLADIFYVLNSSVNFLVYYFMGRTFRNQFLKLVRNSFCCRMFKITKLNVSTSSKNSKSKEGKGMGDKLKIRVINGSELSVSMNSTTSEKSVVSQ